jgi:hypothetical protein
MSVIYSRVYVFDNFHGIAHCYTSLPNPSILLLGRLSCAYRTSLFLCMVMYSDQINSSYSHPNSSQSIYLFLHLMNWTEGNQLIFASSFLSQLYIDLNPKDRTPIQLASQAINRTWRETYKGEVVARQPLASCYPNTQARRSPSGPMATRGHGLHGMAAAARSACVPRTLGTPPVPL